ncbi:hypothetical protein LTS15_008336 [Exophiala xenobiotica]|nr:hypothetical protein LTS15_008336 [Exophiala xenobiotica]
MNPPGIVPTADCDADYEPPLDILCEVCSNVMQQTALFDASETGKSLADVVIEQWPHHTTRQAVTNAASLGCHLCSLLKVQAADLPPDQQTLVLAYGTKSYPAVACGLLNKHGLCDSPVTHASIVQEAIKERELHGAWRSTSTASRTTIEKARHWLEECRSQHNGCSGRGVFSTSGPNRLVVLSRSPTNKLVARVCEQPDTGPEIEYLTLSYSWGKAKRLKLNRSTYDTFHEQVPIADLPLTLKDGIDITWRLGYQAIWIDALCIVQDDDDDWKAESAKMGHIYGNSVCTIACLTGLHSDSGIYARREPLALVPCRIQTAKGEIVFFASQKDEMVARARGIRGRPQLHTRGWVVQERALSPRTLHFSSIDIFWECCSQDSMETEHSVHRDLADYFAHGKVKSDISQTLRSSNGGPPWHDQWWHLVDYYTGCDLSYSTDRWPAISGLATMFLSVSETPLMCGLWRARIMTEMLWQTSNPWDTEASRHHVNPGLPSWSWLSNNHSVRLSEGLLGDWDNSKFLAEVLSLPAPEQFDDLGSPRSHDPEQLAIKLRAPLLKCRMRVKPNGKNMGWFRINSGRLDEVTRQCIEDGRWLPDTTEIASSEHIWALQWTIDDNGIHLLILEPYDDSPTRWRRIGYSRIWCGDRVERVRIGDVQNIDLV